MPEIAELAALLRAEYQELKSWDKVAGRHFITKPLAWRIAKKGYEPKRFDIRKALELPLVATVTPVLADIPFGAQALYAKMCPCGQWFIPNSGNRARCFICSPFRKRKKKDSI
jgi:hypothetical protein